MHFDHSDVFVLLNQCAEMVMSDWWVVAALLKDIFDSAMTVCGDLCAVTPLTIMLLQWCASNWEYQILV